MSLPYFREWVDDWRASPMVRLMTLEQRGAYHEMLCVSWQIGPLPNNHDLLSRLLGINIETFERVWVYPLCDCWKETKPGLVNARLEQEREWAEARQEKARKAANAKWERERLHEQSPSIAMPEQCPSNAIQIQNQIQIQKKKEKAGLQPARLSLVRWEPKPIWKKGHASLEQTQLIVDRSYLIALQGDFPRVEGNGDGGGVQAEIGKFKRHWLSNPSKARRKRDWPKTLTNWLKGADERFDDARFKQARASPATSYISSEREQFGSQRPDDIAAIAACVAKHGDEIHSPGNLITSGERSLMRWCQHKCGYAERKTPTPTSASIQQS